MWKKFRSWPKGGQIAVWVVLGIIAFGIIGAAAGGGGESTGSADTSSSAPSNTAEPAPQEKPAGTDSNVATDDYTPHVGQGTPVVVDQLTWRVTGSPYSAATLGDNEYTGATANGVFVVVPMTVRNGKNETVTVNASMLKLVAGGKEYESDNEGQVALMGSGQKSFFLEDIGPDLSQPGTVVFDVPKAALGAKPEVCAGELGFGPSRGCIALTSIS